MKYADVIVDLSLEKLDKTYQYAIPSALEENAAVGVQVIVPFGNGQRRLKGYIVDISEKPKIAPEKIKQIQEVISGATVIEAELIRLAWWIRDTYGSTMNEALKTVIPVKQEVRAQEKKRVRMLVSKEDAQLLLEEWTKKHYKARVRLLTELVQMPDGTLDYRLVTQEMKISVQMLKGLAEQGILALDRERVYRNPIRQPKTEMSRVTLNEEQEAAVRQICADVRQGISKTYLLFGVTGSGKTEVYLSVIDRVLAVGKQVIMLIPEIALTYQTVNRFYQRFGERVSVLHSKMSKGERYDQYLRAKNGEIDVMIGPRSALFTPFARLGMIIIDEEHEGTYKSDHPPKYHARETAMERAGYCGASVLLGSATPSAESWYRVRQGEYTLLTLHRRAGNASLPKVFVEDLREELKAKNYSIFSRRLYGLIEDRLKKREQILLFLNRRGYAGFVSCRECGHVMKCPHCDVSMKYHQAGFVKGRGQLVCHYCGYQAAMPQTCPECGSKYIGTFGIGTQQVEEIVRNTFPKAVTLRMDTDTTSGKYTYEQILSAFAEHRADILIGTQMIVKGHDFPLVTLVGILAADMSLYANDYRASERTFQLLCQAAGRAGRGNTKGEVVIQTYHPEEVCILAAAKQDYEKFMEQELAFRHLLGYPPAASILAVLVLSKEEWEAVRAAGMLADAVRQRMEGSVGCSCLGPSPASVARVNDIYRQVIYVKSSDDVLLKQIKQYLEAMINTHLELKQLDIQFDWNPVSGY